MIIPVIIIIIIVAVVCYVVSLNKKTNDQLSQREWYETRMKEQLYLRNHGACCENCDKKSGYCDKEITDPCYHWAGTTSTLSRTRS